MSKNPLCMFEAGSPECLGVTWTTRYNPCHHCEWWDTLCGEDDREA